MAIEHITKQAFLDKVFNFETNKDWKFEGELSRLFNIRSIPAILYVPKNGKPQMSVGLSGKDTYVKAIQDFLLANDSIKK